MRDEDKTREQLLQEVAELRQRLEAAERQSSDQTPRTADDIYRMILESMTDSAYILDRDWRVVLANDAIAHMVQIPKEKMLGKRPGELVPGTEDVDFFKTYQRVMETRIPGAATGEYVAPDGQRGWYEVRVFPALQGILCIVTDITEQVQAERTRRASETPFRLLTENAQDIVYRFRLVPTWRFEYISPAVTAITGYTPEEFYADPDLIFKIAHPDDRALLRQSTAQGTSEPFTIRWVCRDGTIIWTEQRNVPIYDQQGNLVALEGAGRDITARVRAEEALRENEQKFRSFVEQSSECFALIDEQGTFIEWNQAQEQLSGIGRDEAIGQSFWDVQFRMTVSEHRQPARHEHFKKTILDTLLTGQGPLLNQLLEVTVQRPDGERRYIQQAVFPIKTDQGYHIGSVARDITDRKRAVEALRESEERFRLAFENANTGMCLVSLDGRLIKVNNRMTEIFGYSQEALESMTVNDIAHPADVDISPDFIQKALAGEIDGGKFEKRYVHQQGHIVWGQVSSSLIRDSQGHPLYFISQVQNITERVRAEEALRESEQKFRTFIEQSSEGFMLVDEEGLLIECNQALERLTGVTRDEVIGQPYWDVQFQVMLPERRSAEGYEHIKTATLEALRTGQSYIFNHVIEAIIQRLDGERRYVQQAVFPIKTDKGYRIGSVTRDITAHVRAEEALRESERKLRDLIEQSYDGIGLTDEHGLITEWNQGQEKITGLTREAVLGRPLWEVLYQSRLDEIKGPGELEALHDEVLSLLQTGQAPWANRISEVGIQRPDGERRVVQSVIFPVSTEGGFMAAIISRDITAHKQAEATLQESEAKYRRLFEMVSDALFLIDNETGQIYEVNPAASATYGYSHAELLQKKNTDLSTEPDQTRRATEERAVRVPLRWHRKKDGTVFPVEIAASHSTWHGRPVQLAAIRDITERQQAQQHTLELAVERERIKILTAFVGDMAHEFGTPLTTIMAGAYLLEKPLPPDKHAQQVALIREQVVYIDRLVKALLALSRLDSGVSFDLVPLHLNDIIRDIEYRIRTLAAQKQITLTIDLPEGIPPVLGDEEELNQAITSLVENAVDYTPPGGTVTVRTYQAGEQIVIAVQDTGIGIDAADLPHIFERFYRVQKARTDRKAGLGLSIAQKIVEGHGGCIEVESTPGQGSTFRVLLPRRG